MVFGLTEDAASLSRTGRGVNSFYAAIYAWLGGCWWALRAGSALGWWLSPECPRRTGAAHPRAGQRQRQFSVGQRIFVIGCGIHIVARFVGVETRQALWWRPGWGGTPGAEMAEDFLDDPGVVNDGYYSHRILAGGVVWLIML